jgi:hypothetical protein
MSTCAILASGMPKSYWGDVFICILVAIPIITIFAIYGDGRLESPKGCKHNMTTYEFLAGSRSSGDEKQRMDHDNF